MGITSAEFVPSQPWVPPMAIQYLQMVIWLPQMAFPLSPVSSIESPPAVNVDSNVDNDDEATVEVNAEKSPGEVSHEKPPIEQTLQEDRAVDNESNHLELDENTT
ncbi:hypothetical protein CJ030_MR1G019571 [Morella rubra]|uniref:Uncharacterized protein n=1 Tax=Morella rubra TaxID=262757 RepID=A0A6A1WLW7_9ROSI|nr:hypothetical protein CJ030_MR1G019571 [Morella rubra]